MKPSFEATKDDAQDSHNLPALGEVRALKNKLDITLQKAILTIITAPQRIIITVRNLHGPIARMRTVAGDWERAYGRKITRETMV
jgi:hypothetical protein